MSYRTWLFIATLGLALPSSVCSQAAPEGQPGQETRSTDSQDSGQGQQAESLNLTPALQGIEGAIRDLKPEEDREGRRQEQDREDRDLSAQEAMAWWAELMFYATAATVVLTFFALVAILRTLHHTRRAADYTEGMLGEAKLTTLAARESVSVAKETGEAQISAARTAIAEDKNAFMASTRPYLMFESISTDWSEAFTWEFRVSNFGNGPAINVQIQADVEFSHGFPGAEIIEIEEFIETLRTYVRPVPSLSKTRLDAGGILRSGESSESIIRGSGPILTYTDEAAVEARRDKIRTYVAGPNYLNHYLVAVAIYDDLHGVQHRTAICWRLGRLQEITAEGGDKMNYRT